MNPGVHEGIVMRFPCPNLECRRWTCFELKPVRCAQGHLHLIDVCPYCDFGVPHASLVAAIRSLLPLPNGELRGPVFLSYN